jgi:hypothetical protein
MVQKCWNKGPLGPSIPWGCFVLAYFNETNETVEKLKKAFNARVVKVDEVKADLDDVPFKYALLWCWS